MTDFKMSKHTPRKQDKLAEEGPIVLKSVGAFCDEEIKTDALINSHSGKQSTANKYL